MKRNNFLKILGFLPFIPLLSEPTKEKIDTRKVVFTPDILKKGHGIFIINTRVKDVKERPGYAATVSWKIGYINHILAGEFSKHRYGVTNFLTDGWFCPLAKDIKDLCEWLNNNPYGESYRPMTKEEIVYLISTRQQGFL